ncbi:uncharacterized protein TNCV_3401521 [Trichonephila clavipes]|nr:uncharacterized protein TNCV_3401521 [Trichonephila clavipes]
MLGYKRSHESGSGGPERKIQKGSEHKGPKRALSSNCKTNSNLPNFRKKSQREETVAPTTSVYNLRPRSGKKVEFRPTIERKTQQGGPVRSRKGRGRNDSPTLGAIVMFLPLEVHLSKYRREPEVCQVIYSQFGLAIHQNDHQARRRFVEWGQNEIAVVPDFHKRILFSDEVHFWLNGYVNKQNCRIWSEANPQVYVETPLHPEKLTVWCALWAGGIIGPYFFKNDEGHNVIANGDRYRAMITNFSFLN